MIDQIAREIGHGRCSRRRALQLLGGAVAVAVVPGLRVGVAAAASCGALGCSGQCCSTTDWSTPGLQGVCCGETDKCCLGFSNPDDPEHTYGWCCGEGYECGDELDSCRAACKAPKFSCGEECCDADAACCPVDENNPTCCPTDYDCTKMITPGNIGITPDSRYVCCPPERLVTALTVSKICCPEGSVRQPSGGLSTAGGFCCTSGNVCAGRDCCDSTPSFPKECVNGRCEFEFLEIEDKAVKAQKDGSVKVPLNMKRPHPVTVSVVVASGGASAAVAEADELAMLAARKPTVLGKRRVPGKRGKRTVKIKLSRRGRRMLKKRRSLRAYVIVTASDANGKAETTTPVTLRRR